MSAVAPPQGVVTFLFTDIEGSTRRWEADAVEMGAALETHDTLLRNVIEEHHGWLFKHTGDGVCAAFSSPKSAVDAAIAAQRALELPVRMGIATGEAELRGEDYFGAVLNRAARIMACGHGGQILLDSQTAGLLSGVDLVELGPRVLRDLAKPVDIFQVQATGLCIEFPPLRTMDPAPGNLRTRTNSFVGREAELTELAAAVQTHRLVTLIGVGGVGKTRLALEVATRVANSFPDGVWVIELAAVTDPVAVPEAAAAVLGITQQPAMSVADSVAAALAGRSRLLIFDNCEHVLDAAAELIETILTQSATVRILATSREGMRVRDEQLWSLGSLGVGADSAASTLFVERAKAVTSGIALKKDTVHEICRRLDGIPLAIELAASRMQSMTVTEVRDRLADRFRLLVGSRRGLERHQTLWHAVQWSYDLLDDAEKLLLTKCSVFAGGFDLTGACAVVDSDDEFITLDLLDALVRKSLLVTDRSTERTRFSMLETIRQFSEEQLIQNGWTEVARTAHARYFAGLEIDVLALWDSPRQREAYTWFSVELANLRAAFRWGADHGDVDTAAAIAVYATFLGGWVEQNEPVGWTEELIEPAQVIRHRRLAQLYAVASQCNRVGRFEDFRHYSEACLTAMESGYFDEVRDEFMAWIAGGYLTAGQPERCIEFCRNGIARSAGSPLYTPATMAIGLTMTGAVGEAMDVSQALRGVAESTGNPEMLTAALLAYGFAHRDADPFAAAEALRRGLSVANESGNQQMESVLAVSLARFAAAHGEPAEALHCLTLAIRHYHDSGSFSLLYGPLAVLAGLLSRRGYHEAAAVISEFADTPMTRAAYPEIAETITHLRDVLGDEVYAGFASAGARMTDAEMAAYAFEQIDVARAEVP